MADEHVADRNAVTLSGTRFETLPSRRTVLRGVAVVGVAGLSGASLAACGGDEGTTSAGGGSAATPTTAVTPTAAGTPTAPAAGAAGGGLAKTSEIPVGGGKIFESEKVVVTQPTAGDFKAFTATCTHQGCTVASVSAGTINCACHGSKFSVSDGSVQNGPAQRPLAAKKVTVTGEDITVA
jgi:Rieske Fe-S protein